MNGSSMSNKMEITWKEMVTAYFTVLFQPIGTEENHKFRTASVPAKKAQHHVISEHNMCTTYGSCHHRKQVQAICF